MRKKRMEKGISLNKMALQLVDYDSNAGKSDGELQTLSDNSLSKYENGRSIPVFLLACYADILGVSIGDLIPDMQEYKIN